MFSSIILTLLATLSSTPWPDIKTKLETAFTQISVKQSSVWNDSSVIISFLNNQGNAEVASGYRDLKKKIKAHPNDASLVGSATKMVTSVAVLQLVEKGIFLLEHSVSDLVDRYLMKFNGTTLVSLFGSNITLVTVRNLLAMRSGLPDYDNSKFRKFQMKNPTYEITPFDILHMCPKKFICAPGSCGWFSSTNYILAGLIIAAHTGPQHTAMIPWDSYDQKSVLPIRPTAMYESFIFTKDKLLSQYQSLTYNVSNGYDENGKSVWDVNADRGWTTGNLLTNAGDLTRFVYDLYTPPGKMLQPYMMSPSAVYRFRPLQNKQLYYGLGTSLLSTNTSTGILVGLIGNTYGFYSEVVYNLNFNFGLTVLLNHEESSYEDSIGTITNLAYTAVLDILNITGY